MRKIALSVLIVITFCLVAPKTFAQCRCWPELTLREHFQRADAVFVGKVIEVEMVRQENADDYLRIMKVEVKQTWKQDMERVVTIKRYPEKGTTSSVQPNDELLFYAYKIKDEEGAFVAGGCCSRTKILLNAAEDLEQFRKMGEKPKKIIDMKAKPNNSFNRSANSTAFIRETCLYRRCVRARLIRALGSC